MRLHLADYHLESCRLNLDLKDLHDLPDFENKAKEHLEIAEEMVKEMGYRRRLQEIEELKKKVKSKNSKVKMEAVSFGQSVTPSASTLRVLCIARPRRWKMFQIAFHTIKMCPGME